MNLVALGLGVFLLAVAVYTASDPANRSRPWVSVRELERDPRAAEEKHRTRTFVYAAAVGLTGLLFVALGLAL